MDTSAASARRGSYFRPSSGERAALASIPRFGRQYLSGLGRWETPASIVSIATFKASAADALSFAVSNICTLWLAGLEGFGRTRQMRARHSPGLRSKALMVNCL